MKIAFFDTHEFERRTFQDATKGGELTLEFFPTRLTETTAQLARGCPIACCFVNDRLQAGVLKILAAGGTKLIALRSAGFNHVDLNEARALGLKVVRVPEYSPYAVAEFSVALLLSLNRKLHRSFSRVHELNFSLEGLVGFDLHGKTIGVIGTGRIGTAFARIMNGFGARLLAFDSIPNEELVKLGVDYTTFERICSESDVISLHVPLTPQTRHLLDANAFAKMKPGVLIINTGRGGLIATDDLVKALKEHRIGGAGLDVYEEEEGVFFEDHSTDGIDDDRLARLLTFPNVMITSHQAFLTEEALKNIAATTIANIKAWKNGEKLLNEVQPPR